MKPVFISWTDTECWRISGRGAHSIVVAKITHLIARGLLDAGLAVSVEKVTAGALMHDIGKTTALKSGGDHSKIGRQICLTHHIDEIADMVGEHVRLKDYDLNGHYSEKEILFYADKRVNHDKIVDLEDRLAYILGRYGSNQEELCCAIKENFEVCKQVEIKLFRKLNFSPESLPDIAKDEKIGSHV